MASIVSFIESLSKESKGFENIKTTFESLGCKVIDNISTYMIYAPNNLFVSAKEPVDEKLQHAIGSIFTKDTNKLICFGFPRTLDYTSDMTIPETLKNSKIVASEYIDGSLLRAFWDGSYWRLSTNGSINAYDSYWISEKSFGELFDSCLSRIYKFNTTFSKSPLVEKLDKSCCYQFLIKHPDVHIDQTTKPFIYHVGTFDLNNLCYVEKTSLNTFRKPKIFSFSSIEEMISNLKDEIKGFVFYSENNIDTQTPRFKILSDKFIYLRKLIGNTPNLYFRYLECSHEGTSAELLTNFPSIKYYSSWVERSLSEIIRNSYSIYVEKYIKRQPNIFINYFYRPIIRDIHKKYFETKQKINIQIVSNIIRSYHPKRLLFILNGLKYLNTNDVIDPTMDISYYSTNTDNELTNNPDSTLDENEDYRQKFGNRFYPLISSIVGSEYAPKVCGMILEMDKETLEKISKDSSELRKLALDALDVLKNH